MKVTIHSGVEDTLTLSRGELCAKYVGRMVRMHGSIGRAYVGVIRDVVPCTYDRGFKFMLDHHRGPNGGLKISRMHRIEMVEVD